MPSQGVVNRRRAVKALLASARTHAPQVGDRLQTNLAAVVEDGETLPDLTHLQFLLVRLLERSLDLRGCCRLAELPEFADRLRLTLPSRRRAAA